MRSFRLILPSIIFYYKIQVTDSGTESNPACSLPSAYGNNDHIGKFRDRVAPTFNVSVGKWVTPEIGRASCRERV